jgi:HEAT repeat protein
MEEVRGPRMRLRPYAIWFLGNTGETRVLPLLLKTVTSDEESVHDRGAALVAVAQVDFEQGVALARAYESRDDFLGYIARDLLKDPSHAFYRRTYLQALFGTGGP